MDSPLLLHSIDYKLKQPLIPKHNGVSSVYFPGLPLDVANSLNFLFFSYGKAIFNYVPIDGSTYAYLAAAEGNSPFRLEGNNIINSSVNVAVSNANPVWVALDILTKPIIDFDGTNILFGGYEGVSLDKVDLDSFIEAAAYCDENKIKFKGVFRNQTTVYNAANQALKVGYCFLTISKGKYTVKKYEDREVVSYIPLDRIVENSIQFTYSDTTSLPKGANVKYYDEIDEYKEKNCSVEAPLDTYEGQIVELDGTGLYQYSDAIAFATYYYNNAINKLYKISFKTIFDGVFLNAGDIIELPAVVTPSNSCVAVLKEEVTAESPIIKTIYDFKNYMVMGNLLFTGDTLLYIKVLGDTEVTPPIEYSVDSNGDLALFNPPVSLINKLKKGTPVELSSGNPQSTFLYEIERVRTDSELIRSIEATRYVPNLSRDTVEVVPLEFPQPFIKVTSNTTVQTITSNYEPLNNFNVYTVDNFTITATFNKFIALPSNTFYYKIDGVVGSTSVTNNIATFTVPQKTSDFEIEYAFNSGFVNSRKIGIDIDDLPNHSNMLINVSNQRFTLNDITVADVSICAPLTKTFYTYELWVLNEKTNTYFNFYTLDTLNNTFLSPNSYLSEPVYHLCILVKNSDGNIVDYFFKDVVTPVSIKNTYLKDILVTPEVSPDGNIYALSVKAKFDSSYIHKTPDYLALSIYNSYYNSRFRCTLTTINGNRRIEVDLANTENILDSYSGFGYFPSYGDPIGVGVEPLQITNVTRNADSNIVISVSVPEGINIGMGDGILTPDKTWVSIFKEGISSISNLYDILSFAGVPGTNIVNITLNNGDNEIINFYNANKSFNLYLLVVVLPWSDARIPTFRIGALTDLNVTKIESIVHLPVLSQADFSQLKLYFNNVNVGVEGFSDIPDGEYFLYYYPSFGQGESTYILPKETLYWEGDYLLGKIRADTYIPFDTYTTITGCAVVEDSSLKDIQAFYRTNMVIATLTKEVSV